MEIKHANTASDFSWIDADNRSIDVKARFYVLEPGDATSYKFMVADHPTHPDELIGCGSLMGPMVSLSRVSVEIWSKDHRAILESDRRDYQEICQALSAEKTYPVNSVIKETKCNPWTAIAFMICAANFLSANVSAPKQRYRVHVGPYAGQTGELIGDIDYAGCRTGWHTLRMPDGKEIIVAGEEIGALK